MAMPKNATPPATIAPPAPAATLAAAMETPPSAALGAPVRIRATPTPSFHLMHHPVAWEVGTVVGEVEGKAFDGPCWLPVLSPLGGVAGSSSGMRTLRQGEPPERAYADAIDAHRRAGWAVLDRTETIPSVYLPAGVPAGPYLRRMACQSARGEVGHVHLEAWNVPIPTVPGRPQAFKFDRAAYNRWRASLVMRGVIQPPTEDVTGPILARLSRAVERKATIPLPDDVRKLHVGRVQAALLDAQKATVPGVA